MIIEIDVTDEFSPAVQRALEHNDAYLRHVAKSVGWFFQKETKKRIREGMPSDQYEERMPYSIRKKLSPKAPRMWYGKLANAIGYEYAGNGRVLIGWTSPSAARYGHLQEQGFQRHVTSAVRAFFAAKANIHLGPNKTVLDIPDRPVFTPMTKVMRPKIPPYVEAKVNSYLEENATFGKRNRRKYKVYG